MDVSYADSVPLMPRQGERDVYPAGAAAARLSPTGGDDEILATVHLVGSRRGVSGGWQRRLPEQCARGLVECADLPIVFRRRDENQPSGGDNGTAVVFADGIRESLL